MCYLKLPDQAKINRVIPKNTFYGYTSAKQKQLFIEVIDKIKWQFELAPDTINLSGEVVKRLQVLEIILKQKKSIETILPIIEKAIPYHIIFVIRFNNEVMLYTSQKHVHPVNENNAVVDWVFKTEWFVGVKEEYQLDLKLSLDKVFEDFCFKVSNRTNATSEESLNALIKKEQKKQNIKNQISKLESQIKRTKQFNKKQPLNHQLNILKKELLLIVSLE